jgi:hypothetical protein
MKTLRVQPNLGATVQENLLTGFVQGIRHHHGNAARDRLQAGCPQECTQAQSQHLAGPDRKTPALGLPTELRISSACHGLLLPRWWEQGRPSSQQRNPPNACIVIAAIRNLSLRWPGQTGSTAMPRGSIPDKCWFAYQ